ncbi:SDR family NAD(P)-dependent oxidoreductase [Tunicatimonas pelagia]|uniref:SDR family NAD(P)-dependent oxidoreductase n=1 Tax=Tunicatimonas pelagia TaxID=931531 RepID=UPI0026670E63|nr:SDR family NAD(P)-dependent oxidoreductase [Tunicatimonas pelagia]WKN42693.1 SDR family NAD(P)-dependent oxidoreductase [Tunicatimonas pelagia]
MNYYFITGTSRGIGRALAERALQEDNTQVIGFSRQQNIQHDRYTHHSIDLSDIDNLSEQIASIFLELSDAKQIVLINNAGTLGDVKYFGSIADAKIEQLFSLNITAPAILMNHFIRQYRDAAAERVIINVSSGVSKYAVDGWSGYCASKAALDMLTEVAALELEKQNVQNFRVYSVAPGIVDTQMQTDIRETDEQNFSRLQNFKNYKADGALDNPQQTAEKYFYLINHPEKFTEVRLDVREF